MCIREIIQNMHFISGKQAEYSLVDQCALFEFMAWKFKISVKMKKLWVYGVSNLGHRRFKNISLQ